jgi:hypothetical protein
MPFTYWATVWSRIIFEIKLDNVHDLAQPRGVREIFAVKMVGRPRFELGTNGLKVRCPIFF